MKSLIKFMLFMLLPAVFIAACGNSEPASPKIYSETEVQSAFEKGACGSCHSIPGISNAAGVIAPSLADVTMSANEHFQSGSYTGEAATAEEYMRESILNPDLFIAPKCPTGACTPNVMPAKLSETLSKDEIDRKSVV